MVLSLFSFPVWFVVCAFCLAYLLLVTVLPDQGDALALALGVMALEHFCGFAETRNENNKILLADP